mgnify:CR=1 FL=1
MATKDSIKRQINKLMKQIENCKVSTEGQGRAMRKACNKNNRGITNQIKALRKRQADIIKGKTKDEKSERFQKNVKSLRTKTVKGDARRKGDNVTTTTKINKTKNINKNKNTNLTNQQKQLQNQDAYGGAGGQGGRGGKGGKGGKVIVKSNKPAQKKKKVNMTYGTY